VAANPWAGTAHPAPRAGWTGSDVAAKSGGAEREEPVVQDTEGCRRPSAWRTLLCQKNLQNARGEFIHVDRGTDPWSDFPGQLVHSPIHFLSMC